MTTDNQTLPNTLITSTWGQQINDGIIQVFANKAALDAGVAGWTPIIGSLAYTTAEKGLWRRVAPGVWESAMPRGYLANVWNSTITSRNDNVWTDAANVAIPGGIRFGCTYLINWSCNPYTTSNNISLWGGYVYITDHNIPGLGSGEAGVPSIAPFGGLNLHKAGGSWPGGVFSSITQSGCAVWGPMPRSLNPADVRWIVGTNGGSPVVTFADVMLSVTEVGGPH